MRLCPRPAHLVPALVGLAVAVTAHGGVLVVDDGGGPGVTHLSLQAAIDAAAEGDTILVRPGDYGFFTIDGKSLIVAADGLARPGLAGPCTIRNIGAAQSVTLRGLEHEITFFALPGLAISNSVGTVFAEDCSFTSTNGSAHLGQAMTPAVTVAHSGRVVFARCELAAQDSVLGEGLTFLSVSNGPHGLQAVDSHVALYQCLVRGAPSFALAGQGGHGAVVAGGTLFATGCQFIGNTGGPPNTTFGTPAGAGGDGVQLTNGLPLSPPIATAPALGRFVDCTFSAGSGGPGAGSVPPGPAGQPLAALNGATALQFAGPTRSFSSTSPVHAGQSTTLSFEAPAGELVFTAAALGAAASYVGSLQGTLVPSLPFVFTALGTVPASGQLVLTIPLPALPAGAGALQVVHQAVFGVAPGSARLGSPSTLVLLDPAY